MLTAIPTELLVSNARLWEIYKSIFKSGIQGVIEASLNN